MIATDSKIDFFELVDKTALICVDPSTTDPVRATLKELEFKFHTAETAEAALERLRYTPYHCVIIHENFAGSSLGANTVLNYLKPLPMAQRRNSFVCAIGESFKTLDAMQAFAHSVHLVVNPSDRPDLAAILKRRLAEFDLHYKIYNNVLASHGEM